MSLARFFLQSVNNFILWLFFACNLHFKNYVRWVGCVFPLPSLFSTPTCNQRRDLESISWVLLMAIPARKETSYWQAWGGGFTGLSNNRSWFLHLWCFQKWECRVTQSAWTLTAVPGKEKSISLPEDCSGDGACSLLARAFCPRYYRNEAKCKPEVVSPVNYSKNKWAFKSNIRTRYLYSSLPRSKSVCVLLRVTTSSSFLMGMLSWSLFHLCCCSLPDWCWWR